MFVASWCFYFFIAAPSSLTSLNSRQLGSLGRHAIRAVQLGDPRVKQSDFVQSSA
jgi:hypothetical protein